jgi:8-oxo-dGTP pyrophosphatase MutT (NUDIX family)
MKQVAKLVLINTDNNYLLLYRSAHPTFGDDPDLPGGTIDPGEQPLAAMVREVWEEAGITIDPSAVRLLYQGTEYSTHGTEYSLYTTTIDATPAVTLSWEHSSFEWLSREAFLQKAGGAQDTFMQMSGEQLIM